MSTSPFSGRHSAGPARPSWAQRLSIEDPRRIRAFRDKLAQLQWSGEDLAASLNVLFAAVDELAEAEIDYYYRRRGTRAWISGLCRVLAWVFGSAGLLLPLLAATTSVVWKELGQYGYACLAIAASSLAANSLFGGTQGHIRFVSTQLELEKLVIASRITWCSFRASYAGTAEQVAQGFALVQAYARSLHELTLLETGRWGETSLAELANFQSRVAAKDSAGRNN